MISIVFVHCSLGFQEDSCCYRYPMIFTFFTVQGAFGLFIVSAHVSSIAFRWTPSKMTRLPFERRYAIQIFLATANLVTILCIIWFFIGHIWIFLQIEHDIWHDSQRDRRATIFGIIMFIIQYIVGIWLLYCWIQNNPQIVH
ncbi:hypothetical protein I4U23_000207 [Adineta vaga]|nr:hypothetical protein I4U23_000207 [Adineta vaga]